MIADDKEFNESYAEEQSDNDCLHGVTEAGVRSRANLRLWPYCRVSLVGPEASWWEPQHMLRNDGSVMLFDHAGPGDGTGVGFDILAELCAAMHGQAIPDHQQGSTDLATECVQALDDLRALDGAGEQPEAEAPKADFLKHNRTPEPWPQWWASERARDRC